jgi:hypothetical protein
LELVDFLLLAAALVSLGHLCRTRTELPFRLGVVVNLERGVDVGSITPASTATPPAPA